MEPRWHDFVDAQVRDRPEVSAVRDSIGTDWTWGDAGLAISDLQDVLTKAGVRPGDRVTVLAENSAAAMAAVFAASRLGAIASPVNARLKAPEVDRVLAHSRPAAVLMTTAVSPDAEAHAARLEARPVEGAFGRMHLATPYGSDPDDLPDVAVLLYTTGTTGQPKGVMLTHGNMIFGGRAAAGFRSITPDDRVYIVNPITHVMGLTSLMTASCCGGAHITFEARFSAARLYEALSEGITLFSGVPQMHAMLMQYTKEQGHQSLPNNRLRYISSGAAPLDPAWKRKAEAFFGVAIQNGYGLTETAAGTSITLSDIGDPDVSVGPPVPGTELRIDESVPGGGDGVGEVVVRGPNVMKGYYRNPEATAEVLDRDGWFRTGDLGKIDGQGRLHIVGRSKELIIHGGFNVYPPEVEAALNDHPQVIQSAVIGRARDGDEEVLAFVQAAPDDLPDPADLKAFVAERLTGYKRPAQIIVGTDLPAAPTGKILKHALLDHFADRLDLPPDS